MHPSIPADSEAAADTPPVHASGSCWRSLARREQARLELVHSRPAAAHDHPQRCADTDTDTDPGIHTGDTLVDRMRHHLQTAYRDGRSQGERVGYVRGWYWGAFCGAFGAVALLVVLVIAYAAIDYSDRVQLISRVTT